jgi:hypothetical protein
MLGWVKHVKHSQVGYVSFRVLLPGRVNSKTAAKFNACSPPKDGPSILAHPDIRVKLYQLIRLISFLIIVFSYIGSIVIPG